jgi:transglutaminase-like putative cysteine protease
LQQQRGACRDITLLFIACCRAAGLAARFVSGFQTNESPRERLFLHAWPEVYLPGGGWRGYDPAHAAMVAEHHLPIAAAAIPVDANPVHGTFIGPPVQSALTADISIRVSL